jgi:hypothetical protein
VKPSLGIAKPARIGRSSAQRLGIKESTKVFGSSASCATISDFIDLEQKTLQPLDNPFGEVVTHL